MASYRTADDDFEPPPRRPHADCMHIRVESIRTWQKLLPLDRITTTELPAVVVALDQLAKVAAEYAEAAAAEAARLRSWIEPPSAR